MKFPARPPEYGNEIVDAFEGSAYLFAQAVNRVDVSSEPYLPWEKFRFHAPPAGFTPQQWWAATAWKRRSQWRRLPLNDINGNPFNYGLPDEVLRLSNEVTSRAGGNIGMAEPVVNPATRDTYVIRSLMEESITSSQLEGAATTRKVAKEMLRSGRSPRDKSEQMIWNNYQAMQFIVQHRETMLTPSFICELHQIVTLGTLDDPADGGRVQTPQDRRVVVGTLDGEVIHEPPPAEELDERMQALCAFANSPTDKSPWLPPVLRAITVHFMVGHDHYFVDGNGRLARALFYWSMLHPQLRREPLSRLGLTSELAGVEERSDEHSGLWLTEFVTISPILRKAPVQYAHSYLNTEYESDLTYFFVHHLRVLDRAFNDLENYLEQKVREAQAVKSLLSTRHRDFNHRQLAVIKLALSDPLSQFTAVSHAFTHHVTVETARQDLIGLAQAGILVQGKLGRAHVWRPAPDAKHSVTIPNSK